MGSGSVADPRSGALPFLQVFKTGGGAAPAAAGGGEARAAGTGEAAKPPLRPRFCTFIKAWGCRAGAPQRGGLPGIKWRVSTTGAEGAPAHFAGKRAGAEHGRGLVQSAKNVNKR